MVMSEKFQENDVKGRDTAIPSFCSHASASWHLTLATDFRALQFCAPVLVE